MLMYKNKIKIFLECLCKKIMVIDIFKTYADTSQLTIYGDAGRQNMYDSGRPSVYVYTDTNKHLYERHNQLTYLDPSRLAGANQLKKLYVEGNYMEVRILK